MESVADSDTIDRASAVFLRTYALSPYPPPMVREKVLATTFCLEPARLARVDHGRWAVSPRLSSRWRRPAVAPGSASIASYQGRSTGRCAGSTFRRALTGGQRGGPGPI
jgi:hypothetical protein